MISFLQKPAKPTKKVSLNQYSVSPIPGPIHLTYIGDSLQPAAPYRRPGIQIKMEFLPPNILGLTKQISPNHYLIVLSPFQTGKQLELTLLHELVHVKQFIRGQLTKRGNNWHWNQKAIDWDQPYLSRPWEQQAFQESAKYLKQMQPQ
ncbi:hypothetical protein N9P49_00940 [bacterium]|nr:hypothetical protein [bacterium]